MTQAQAALFARAIERAEAEGIRIMGRGTIKATGAGVFAVSSSRDAMRAYLVTVNGGRLECDCAAGKSGRYCKHRSVVSRRLTYKWVNRPISIWK